MSVPLQAITIPPPCLLDYQVSLGAGTVSSLNERFTVVPT
jgi:hypothetical protein